jgi:hypothetical protein
MQSCTVAKPSNPWSGHLTLKVTVAAHSAAKTLTVMNVWLLLSFVPDRSAR